QGLGILLVLLCAVGALVQATNSVNSFMKEAREEERKSTLPKFTLQTTPVGKATYEAYARVLGKISKQVAVKADHTGLIVSIHDVNHFPEFMYVLNSVQGLSQRVIWKAESICLAKCDGAKAIALIKGVEESIEVSLKGEES
ncbi:MAG: hypothetical protein R3194_03395, partial [Limnobacter sp.]|nr:hypothetical protein [Limnobacter sp.]